MTREDLSFLTAAELAPLYRTRQLSPVEVVAAVLERIAAVDGRLNSFRLVMAEPAMAAAKAAEQAILRGGWLGPLHGVPIGLKDLYDVAGVPTTFGSKILAENVPQRDATVVQRLKAAGAVILGKHNLHEFAFGVTNENPHYGDVHNPWDLDRVPGGSSGGTAVATAAGLGVGGLGSDTGGSIRIPAAVCGTAGIKPTYGRVSRHGAMPLSWSLDHVGPLARSMADCALILQAISGHDPLDPSTAAGPVPDFSRDLERGVRGLKLGVPREHFFAVIEPGVEAAVRAAIRLLVDLGAEVVEISVPTAVHAQAILTPVISSEGAAYHEPWLKSRNADYGDDVRARLQLGAVTLATQYLKGQRLRAQLQAEFAAALAEVDAVVAPSVPVIAPRIGQSFVTNPATGYPGRAMMNRCTCPSNLTGLPAASVPCGFSEGMPVGLQVIGRAWDEPTVLRIAAAYEAAAGWQLRPNV